MQKDKIEKDGRENNGDDNEIEEEMRYGWKERGRGAGEKVEEQMEE